MSRSAKIWLVAATLLVVIGAVTVAAVMTVNHGSLAVLDTRTEKTYTVSEDFDKISIRSFSEDIAFVHTDDSESRVVCFTDKNTSCDVNVNDGTLVININNIKKWYENISFSSGSQRITVYLPKAAYTSLLIDGSAGDVTVPDNVSFGDVDISVSTGDVTIRSDVPGAIKIMLSTGETDISGITAGNIRIKTSTGKIRITDTVCFGMTDITVTTGDVTVDGFTGGELISSGNTGDITLVDACFSGDISVERSTGDVKLRRFDAANISIKTTTGTVKGDILSPKIFLTETSTGNIRVPRSTSGGKCKITTSTGDIIIE